MVLLEQEPQARIPRASQRSNEERIVARSSETLVKYCFDVLFAELQGRYLPRLPPKYHFVMPIFVTWYKPANPSTGEGEQLRGCIGSLSALQWSSGLADYSIKSALRDDRFQPINIDELPELACKLSVLHSFERCRDPYDWIIGTHGILINFAANGQKWSATYLPEIALEHGMSHQVAIAELVRKSGYPGHVSAVLPKMHVQRYQSNLAHLTYDQWYDFPHSVEW